MTPQTHTDKIARCHALHYRERRIDKNSAPSARLHAISFGRLSVRSGSRTEWIDEKNCQRVDRFVPAHRATLGLDDVRPHLTDRVNGAGGLFVFMAIARAARRTSHS